MHASDRRRTLATALEPLEQVAQVLVQPLLVRLGRDAVRSHCAVLVRASVRLFHLPQVDVVRQISSTIRGAPLANSAIARCRVEVR